MKKFANNLKELGFDSISIRMNGNREIFYIAENFDKWEEWLEYQNKYTRKVVGIIIGNVEFEKEIVIGQLIGTFFEPEAQMNDADFWDVCDSIDGDLECMASEIVDNNLNISEEICTMNNSIFYIDELFIDEKYREHGIGKFVLKQLDKFMLYSLNLDVGTIVTYPFAMEGTIKDGYKRIKDEEKFEETLKRVKKFYRSCGFKNVGKFGHMYKKYGDTFDYYK